MKLIQDFGIRALLAVILVLSMVGMIFTDKNVPEGFITLVSMAVAFYFSNRSTMDKNNKYK